MRLPVTPARCITLGAKWSRLPCLLAAVAHLNGCLVVPTPPHGSGLIAAETIEALEVRHTSRADVLLAFADPRERHEGDRFFVYEWTVTQGYLLWGAYYSGGAIPIEGFRCLVLEFDDAGMLERKATISASGEDDARRQTATVLDGWASGPPAVSE